MIFYKIIADCRILYKILYLKIKNKTLKVFKEESKKVIYRIKKISKIPFNQNYRFLSGINFELLDLIKFNFYI